MKKISIFSGVSLVTIALCQTSLAQTSAAQPETGGLDEIVVTAQRRSEQSQDVPIAITSVTSEALAALRIDDTRDLRTLVPSLNPSVTGVTLRGVGTSVRGPGFEKPIATYIDGVYISSGEVAYLAFNNVAQIDVLRGPQGTLFGRNTTGGVIQITTDDPSRQTSVRGSVSYGNYDTSLLRAYGTTGLGEDAAIDLAVQYRTQGEGYGINEISGREVNRTDHESSVRARLLVEPTPETRIVVAADYSEIETSNGASLGNTGVPFFLMPAESEPRNIRSDIEPNSFIDSAGLSLRFEQDFNGVRFVSITAYREANLDPWFIDLDVTELPLATATVVSHENQFSQEFQLLSDTDNERFQWVVGLYYFDASGDFSPSRVEFLNPAASPAPGFDRFDTVSTQTVESLAAFAEANFGLTDTTRLTLGARITHEEREFDGAFLGFSGGLPPGGVPFIGPLEAEMSVTEPTWRVVLDHRVTSDLLIYASYNRGFKSGGFNAQVLSDPPYDPELVDAYEIGVKSDWFNNRLRANAAAYFYDYSNYQVQSFVAGANRITNAAVEIQGVELELQAAVTDSLLVTFGAAYTDAEFTSYPDATIVTPNTITGGNTLTVGDASGNRLPYVPETTANLGARYRFPLIGGEGALQGNIYYNGGWFSEADNLFEQDAYVSGQVSIGWTAPGERFSIQFWGKDLTNSDVATQISSSPLGTAIQYTPPPTYGVELGFRF